MRIIGGALRGKRLRAPPGDAARPTAERAREAAFDMLVHAAWGGPIAGIRVLDAFAGTGALGLEALSRGAAEAVFFEPDRSVRAVLGANIEACGAKTRARVVPQDATRPPPGVPCQLIFLDPPYGTSLAGAAAEALEEAGWIAEGALIVAEGGRKESVPPLGELLAERVYGAARLSFWRARARPLAQPGRRKSTVTGQ
ncbi:MAG: 16S rRNA (guanine(966)-N(2))-methyltransferase RsmD [Acetobacteraceae bacterium]